MSAFLDCFSFILQVVYSLAQSQYLDEYIFKVAEGISPHHGNLAVGTLESIGGVTKLLVAWICNWIVVKVPMQRYFKIRIVIFLS